MIELLFADCNCQSLTKKFPLRCQKFPHSSQISSQISVGFANFVDMGLFYKINVSKTRNCGASYLVIYPWTCGAQLYSI